MRCIAGYCIVQKYDTLSTLSLKAYLECCGVLCCAVVCCAVVCCAVLCCAVVWCAVLCCAVVCCAVLCCAVMCCAVLCCAVLCCAMLYITSLWTDTDTDSMMSLTLTSILKEQLSKPAQQSWMFKT